MKIKPYLFVYSLLLLFPVISFSQTDTLFSPSKKLKALVFLTHEGQINYSLIIEKPGKSNPVEIIDSSALGFAIKYQSDLSRNFKLVDSKKNSQDVTWTQVWGQRMQVRNNYNELIWNVQEKSGQNRKMEVVFRLYDDGFAFRYIIPQQTNLGQFEITDELTEFIISPKSTCWWSVADYDTQEKEFSKTLVSDASWVNTPFVIQTPDNVYLAIHEAALINYPAMTLKTKVAGKFTTDLVPWNDGIRVKAKSPMQSPWRMVIVSTTPEGLLDSDLLLNLNEPCKIEDVTWIQPMKYIGIWWAMHLGTKKWTEGERHAATTNEAIKYIDFAKERNIQGVVIEGWNKGWENWGKDSAFDQITPTKDFDLIKVADYANKAGVKLIGHHETGGDVIFYEQNMEKAFAQCQKLSIHAVKTGYAGGVRPSGEHHFGQYMVNHFQKVTEVAARFKIMLDVHETVKPTGLCRTWPNLMTGEGVRGMEWEAWSKGNSPSHTAILPFMRGIAGPMDYTPGIFDITYKNRKEYVRWNGQETEGIIPRVHSTLCHQMALWVVLYSPMQMAADAIENYKSNLAFGFFESISMDFIQSSTLMASIGEYVVTARQMKNGNWIVGAINNETPRELLVRIPFYTPGKDYEMTIYKDADNADFLTNPEAYVIEKAKLSSQIQTNDGGNYLKIKMAAGGGQAIVLKPL